MIRRSVACLLLLVMLESIIQPTVAYALTTGPHQPEYTSYESPGASDMVNLTTGDFTFSLPVLDVPGPEGSFSVPLTYNAGIGLEQQASWVGLGWTINVGAITRSINQFPDDASGELNNVVVQDLVGVRGWEAMIPAIGSFGWNNQQGHYGQLSLLSIVNAEWSGGQTSVGVAGINVTSNGMKFNPVQFAFAAATIASAGATLAKDGVAEVVKQQAVSLSVGATMSVASRLSGIGSASTSGYWAYESKERNFLVFRKFRTWLDKTRDEKMYGVLFLGAPNKVAYSNSGPTPHVSLRLIDATGNQQPLWKFEESTPTANLGSASDINYQPSKLDGNKEFYQVSTPSTLALDNFSVKAAGISGSITPYRLEVGSVAMPREMTPEHDRLIPVPYDVYKVPFRYDGQFANSYIHHAGSSSSTVSTPTPYFGLTTLGPPSIVPGFPNKTLTYRITDPTLLTSRVSSDVPSSGKIPAGNDIDWLTNQDIRSGITYGSRFMDFLSGGQTVSTTSARYIFRNSLPFAGQQSLGTIGGFCIAGPDGTTYHFALPVYDYDLVTEMREIANPTTRRSVITRTAGFANSWLLTGITGPDFIDRNNNGLIDENDWGRWVKFNYGRHSNTYQWSIPYSTSPTTSPQFRPLPGGTHETSTRGKKQLYYLNTIETRSHVAMFQKSPRLDGKSAGTEEFPLGLDNIFLVSRSVYNKLITATNNGGYGMENYSNSFYNVLNNQAISQPGLSFIKQNCEKQVKFSYTYDLARQTSNSSLTGIGLEREGRLTLNRVSIMGRNGIQIVPDYKFEYGLNPNYNKDHWDAWGAYNPNGTSASTTHTPTADDSHAGAWSLSKIINPLGSEIAVSYEKDVYSSVSGLAISGQTIPFSRSGVRLFQSDLPANRVYVESGSMFTYGEKIGISGTVTYKCKGGTSQTRKFAGEYPVLDHSTTTVDVNGVPTSLEYIDLGENYMNIDPCSLSTGEYLEILTQEGTVAKLKKGDNLRVASITLRNEIGQENKIKYRYGLGVISQLPEYLPEASQFDFPSGHPQTPVMYGNVTILSGKLTTNSDYHTKQVYQFETPNISHYNLDIDPTSIVNGKINSEDSPLPGPDYDDYLNVFENKITDKTSRIGRLNSITTFDALSNKISSTAMEYNDANTTTANNKSKNYHGVYTEGTLMVDRVTGPMGYLDKVHKINRTTTIHYPNVLTRVLNEKDGFTSETRNLLWDFITGRVLEKLDKSSNDLYVKSVIKPAYIAYPEMASKAENPLNKNMLMQDVASYTYRSDANGSLISLLDGSATTFNKSWSNYRIYNTTTGAYEDTSDDNNPTRDDGNDAIDDGVWRIHKSWTYVGAYGDKFSDGSLKFSVNKQFDHNSSTHPGWILTNQVDRYDHYGMPLVVKDVVNNLYSTTRMGYDDGITVTGAQNVAFTEIAFSSAEDVNNNNFFGGEVALKDGTVKYVSKGDIAESHTGDAAVSLATGSTLTSFVFKPTVGDIVVGRSYRASVWTNSVDGRVYYKLNNGAAQVSPAPTISKKAGNWYQLNIAIPITATITAIEIGVRNAGSGAVLFDDFRFQPGDVAMSCRVVNQPNFFFNNPTPVATTVSEYFLDNDNMFIKNVYNEKGKLSKVYRESFKYGINLMSEYREDYRRFHYNQ